LNLPYKFMHYKQKTVFKFFPELNLEHNTLIYTLRFSDRIYICVCVCIYIYIYLKL